MDETTPGDEAGTASELGARPLRDWRAERLLAIRDLARAARVAPSTVYMIEAGRTVPRPSVMRRISSALAVDARQVVEFRRAVAQHAEPGLSGRIGRDVAAEDRPRDHPDGRGVLRHAPS